MRTSRPSQHAHGTLFVISAPSGAGKTSLVRALVRAQPTLTVSVSHTTRPRRSSERDGQDYYFVDVPVFSAMVRRGELLEHAVVFDHHYGTSAAAVSRARAEGKDVILEIDWQGAQQVRAAMADCVSVVVFPPSLNALEQRLRNRGQDSDAVIERRMRDAVEELRHYPEFDYLVVNDDFEVALADLQAIVRAERNRTSRRTATEAILIEDLLRKPTLPGRGTRASPGRAAEAGGARPGPAGGRRGRPP